VGGHQRRVQIDTQRLAGVQHRRRAAGQAPTRGGAPRPRPPLCASARGRRQRSPPRCATQSATRPSRPRRARRTAPDRAGPDRTRSRRHRPPSLAHHAPPPRGGERATTAPSSTALGAAPGHSDVIGDLGRQRHPRLVLQHRPSPQTPNRPADLLALTGPAIPWFQYVLLRLTTSSQVARSSHRNHPRRTTTRVNRRG
jgi:hypothetical protein